MNKIKIFFAICIFCFSCNNEEPEVVSFLNGKGSIEALGKSFPFNEAYKVRPSPTSDRFLDIRFTNCYTNSGACNSLTIRTPWSIAELFEGTFENIGCELSLYDETERLTGEAITNSYLYETKLVVKKSGSDYNITYTGKANFSYLDPPLQDFTMTWKGKIR